MTEQPYGEKQPKIFWQDTIVRHRDSLSDAAISVLDRQENRGRRVIYSGLEHIPSTGPVILAANHYVRMSNEKRALGPHKMEDLLSSLGALTHAARERRGESAKVIWTPSRVPRPEALMKKGASAQEVLKWLAAGSPSMGVSNLSRTLFLSLYKNSQDVLPIPYDANDRQRFFETIKQRLQNGEVLGIFPEGEVSNKLRRGRLGAAHIAIESGAPVIPVAQYNRGGDLVVSVGSPLTPPADRSGARQFLGDIMHTIRDMLPPELHGFYAKP